MKNGKGFGIKAALKALGVMEPDGIGERVGAVAAGAAALSQEGRPAADVEAYIRKNAEEAVSAWTRGLGTPPAGFTVEDPKRDSAKEAAIQSFCREAWKAMHGGDGECPFKREEGRGEGRVNAATGPGATAAPKNQMPKLESYMVETRVRDTGMRYGGAQKGVAAAEAAVETANSYVSSMTDIIESGAIDLMDVFAALGSYSWHGGQDNGMAVKRITTIRDALLMVKREAMNAIAALDDAENALEALGLKHNEIRRA